MITRSRKNGTKCPIRAKSLVFLLCLFARIIYIKARKAQKARKGSRKEYWHGFCRSKSMKYAAFISIVTLVATMSFAQGSAMPESSVPPPAEKMEPLKGAPDLGAKESAEWQKLRAERKQAREQILSRLRESNNVEKQQLRQDVSKKRNEKSHFEGKPPKPQPRERQSFHERPDSPNMNPAQGYEPLAPPWWWGPLPPK